MHQFIKFILFSNDTLHVLGGLSVHHQGFKTVHTATSGTMKKVTLTVPWGQYDPTVKKKNQNINTVYYNVLFPQIIFHSTDLYSNIDK